MRTPAPPSGWRSEPLPRAMFTRQVRGGGCTQVVQWDRRTFVLSVRRSSSDGLRTVMTVGTLGAAVRAARAYAGTVGGWADDG